MKTWPTWSGIDERTVRRFLKRLQPSPWNEWPGSLYRSVVTVRYDGDCECEEGGEIVGLSSFAIAGVTERPLI